MNKSRDKESQSIVKNPTAPLVMRGPQSLLLCGAKSLTMSGRRIRSGDTRKLRSHSSMICWKRKQALWGIVLLLNLVAGASNYAQSRFVTTRGRTILAPDGRTLVLKGVNLGNWLLPEGYMFKFKTTNSPRLIQIAISELVGEDEARQFWKTYRDNYITREDISFIKRSGFNSVRVPFSYRLFVSDGSGPRLEGPGYELLDRVVDW